MPFFQRYIGIDYSGAQTPTSSLKGLRVFMADGDVLPEEILPLPVLANTGPVAALPSGWLSESKKINRPLSVSTTAFRSLYDILRFTTCCLTGRPSSTISSITGRLMVTILM
jgi:hypothetical protein